MGMVPEFLCEMVALISRSGFWVTKVRRKLRLRFLHQGHFAHDCGALFGESPVEDA